MNIDWIETFLDLSETRSFNRSAARLGVTQSTVSGRIRALEAELGCRLLERSRAGTELSAEGRRFAPQARNLRLAWTAAKHSVRGRGTEASMRIGIQHDLLDDQVGAWVATLRSALPDTALYVEADYSTQMCLDVMGGHLDLAILFTPKTHPDLHFESLGEVGYQMISSEAANLDQVDAESYILAHYAPAFSAAHAELLPWLSFGAVSSGQNGVVRGLVTALGGSAYVLEQSLGEMEKSGAVHRVEGAPRIDQPVYAVVHLRNRHRGDHRRVLRRLREHLLPDVSRPNRVG